MYCPRCGNKNDDDAQFCKKCGHDLQAPSSGPAPVTAPKKSKDDQCEEDCKGSDKEQSWFWGVIVVVVGVWVIWEFGLKNVVDVPDWVNDNDMFCTIIWVVIGIAILMAGVRMISRRSRQ